MRFLLLFLLLPFGLRAQQASDSTEPAFQFTLGADFTTTPVYGIVNKDTSFSNQLSVGPILDLQHRSGIGFRYNPFFVVSGAQTGLQYQQLSLYFERYGEKSWDIDVFYSHFFFSGNTNFPQTPINNEVYGMIGYRKLLLQPSLSAAYGFGKAADGSTASDVSLAASLAHKFSGISRKIEWSVSPSLSLNTGTGNNYSLLSNARYIARSQKFANRRLSKKKAAQAASVSAATSGSNDTGFAVRNVELGIYSSFEAGKFEVVPMGSLFVPLKKGDSFDGYWQLGLRYHF